MQLCKKSSRNISMKTIIILYYGCCLLVSARGYQPLKCGIKSGCTAYDVYTRQEETCKNSTIKLVITLILTCIHVLSISSEHEGFLVINLSRHVRWKNASWSKSKE